MVRSQSKSLVSVLVPAYNRPDYTRKLLHSVVEQEYRPIEIVLSDDCSPVFLEPLAREFSLAEDDSFRVEYYRQTSNLGVMGNFGFVVSQASGEYLVPFAHDNWFTDKRFLSEAVEIMETHQECHMCVANAVYENMDWEMLSIPPTLDVRNRWAILEGDAFIRLWHRPSKEGGIRWTQAIVVRSACAQSLGAFHEPFMVSEQLARKLGVGADNAMGYMYVLSAVGSVALTGKVVCQIGRPDDSYSRSDPKWNETRTKTKFIVFYNIYRANLKGKYAKTVKHEAYVQAMKQAFLEPIGPDLRIIRHYHYSLEVLAFMALSALNKAWSSLKELWRLLKRTLHFSLRGEWAVLLQKARARITS